MSNYAYRIETVADMLIRAAQSSHDKGITFLLKNGIRTRMEYPELLQKSSSILAILRKSGVSPQEPVLLQIHDLESFVQSFWACVLGGMIPLPLKPVDLPGADGDVARFLQCWKHLGSPPILSDRKWEEVIPIDQAINMKWIFLGEHALVEKEAERAQVRAEDAALYLLTSGTTGIPKCARFDHQHLVTSASAFVQAHSLTPADVIMNWMPLYHTGGLLDYHVVAIFLGCNQVLSDVSTFLEKPVQWCDWVESQKVTVTWAPNFAFELLCQQEEQIRKGNWNLSSLRYVINGGQTVIPRTEKKLLDLLKPFGVKQGVLVPVYGMTEATGAVTSFHSQGQDGLCFYTVDKTSIKGRIRYVNENHPDGIKVSDLGYPLPGMNVRIVNDAGEALLQEHVGKIQISGSMVIDEYVGNPEANCSHFTEDGWFDTGDLGFLKNGRISIVGREKDILIINGKNYYNHEIETAVETIYGVKGGFTAAGAIPDVQSGTDRLAVFFIPMKMDEGFLVHVIRDIRSHLGKSLGIQPSYLIPLSEEQIPKTDSGKIKRDRLMERLEQGYYDSIIKKWSSQRVKSKNKQQYIVELSDASLITSSQLYDWIDSALKSIDQEKAILSVTENRMEITPINDPSSQSVRRIWEEVLGYCPCSDEDSLFEVGGGSLQAMQILSMCRNRFHVSIRLKDFYDNPTIAGLVRLIAERSNGKEKKEGWNLTPSQESLWFIYRSQPQSAVYTGTIAVHFEGSVDITRLESSLDRVIQRHDALRVRFLEKNGTPMQIIDPHLSTSLLVTDLSEYVTEIQEQEKLKIIQQETKTPIDLLTDPMFRFRLIKLKEKEHLLLVSTHHIVTDGQSMEIFVKDLLAFYQDNPPEDVDGTYVDWIEMSEGQTADYNRKLNYWKERLSNPLPVLEFPTDYPRPAVIRYAGDICEMWVEKEIVERLQHWANQQGSTLYTALLALYAYLLYRYTQQKEMLIGTPVANRMEPGTEKVIGYFSNVLPLKFRIDSDMHLDKLFHHVKEVAVDALDHQGISLETLIRHLDFPKNTNIPPLVQTMFSMRNEITFKHVVGQMQVTVSVLASNTSKVDFILYAHPRDGQVHLSLEYNTDLYKKETMQRLLNHYYHLLVEVSANVSMGSITVDRGSEYGEES